MRSKFSRTDYVTANQYWSPGMLDRRQHPRDDDSPITKGEFYQFRNATFEYRDEVLHAVKSIITRLDGQDNVLNSQNLVLDEIKDIKKHVEVTCRIARWTKAAIITVAAVLAAMKAIYLFIDFT